LLDPHIRRRDPLIHAQLQTAVRKASRAASSCAAIAVSTPALLFAPYQTLQSKGPGYSDRRSLYSSLADSKSPSRSRDASRSRKSSRRRANKSSDAESSSRFVSTMSRHVEYGLPANRSESR